jgi:hypothetical protein
MRAFRAGRERGGEAMMLLARAKQVARYPFGELPLSGLMVA